MWLSLPIKQVIFILFSPVNQPGHSVWCSVAIEFWSSTSTTVSHILNWRRNSECSNLSQVLPLPQSPYYKFYHFFEIPSTQRMFNPLPSAQKVSMHMLRLPKKVLKIIKTEQKGKMKKKQEQQRQQIRNRRPKTV